MAGSTAMLHPEMMRKAEFCAVCMFDVELNRNQAWQTYSMIGAVNGFISLTLSVFNL